MDKSSAFASSAYSTPMKCPHCGADAHLMRMQPAGQGQEKRTFECAKCEKPTMVTVQI